MILRKYQQKEHKKYKGSLSTLRITCSFARFSSSRCVLLHAALCFIVIRKTILCDVEETTCTTNSFVVLPRLHGTAVDCAHELINGESRIKGKAGKNYPKLINE